MPERTCFRLFVYNTFAHHYNNPHFKEHFVSELTAINLLMLQLCGRNDVVILLFDYGK